MERLALTPLTVATRVSSRACWPGARSRPRRLRSTCVQNRDYDNEPARQVVVECGRQEHIRCIGKKKGEAGQKAHPARWWMAERAFSWLSR